MRRRELIAAFGCAVMWPLAAHGQQGDRARRVGIMMNYSESDAEGRVLLTSFSQRLRELGWTEGRNIQFEYRWTVGAADGSPAVAAELARMKPDVILVSGGTALAALMRETRSIPSVFVAAADPVELGYVASLARPGGNVTGFTAFERTIGPKWLQILKEIAPDIKRVLLLNPNNPANALLQPAILESAPLLRIEVNPVAVRNASEIERAIEVFAREPDSA